MYKLRIDNGEKLKDGRKMIAIAETIGVTNNYLSNIFNQKKLCTKMIAICLISLKENICVNDSRMEYLLDYYFEKVA